MAGIVTTTGAAGMPAGDVLAHLTTTRAGLTGDEAAARLARVGPNAVRSHRASAFDVLRRQLRSAVLALLFVTALVSFFLGQRTDAVVISTILAMSISLGFVNEYRAERATEALHDSVHHTAVAVRDGRPQRLDVVDLVPGDIVHVELGEVVPADLRLISTTGLECDESVLTGESVPVEKSTDPVAVGASLGELTGCALMGTVVHAGAGVGVVVATGARAEFGRIAADLGGVQPETSFQLGLRRFSELLLRAAAALTVLIFVTNTAMHRPLLDSLLFSLAIAVGITPQLLPAVVSISLASGSRRLAARKVLVKRLVCIEDLGDIDILVTDKTGTLTDGEITFGGGLAADGSASDAPVRLALLEVDVDVDVDAAGSVAVGGNPLDLALWRGTRGSVRVPSCGVLGRIPFDHERRMASVVVEADGGGLLVTKGAPESVLARCIDVPPGAEAVLQEQFRTGARVVAVATRRIPADTPVGPDLEHDLALAGFLVFADRPRVDVADALVRLGDLGVAVKVATGDNAVVAATVCRDLGIAATGASAILTGAQIDQLADDDLAAAARDAAVFARVSPEQKARIVRLLRRSGRAVAFLGDGVNDALALHHADVGISVESATDVAKDAADILLLEKSLSVLADGIAEGRRIFANTMKYVLMGTSSNFGNMFSAAAASAFLPFLPMLPSQILLNNLLYDASQLTIPTDRVDPEQVRRPAHWDIAFVRRFMLVFGPISSLFDFATFAILLGPLHASADVFRSGWFVESLATQTLVIFVIRTRRVPFLRSRPSGALVAAAFGVVACAVALPLSPLAGPLGFGDPPRSFYLIVPALVVLYLLLIEVVKTWFFRFERGTRVPARRRGPSHRVHRRASRFSTSRLRPSRASTRRIGPSDTTLVPVGRSGRTAQ